MTARPNNPAARTPPRTLRGRGIAVVVLSACIAVAALAASPGSPSPRPDDCKDAASSPITDNPKWADHWSFQPVRRPEPPRVNNTVWVTTPVDAFVLAALEQRGLTPNREADKLTLIRRATLDLTGLPPTPQEIQAFLADDSPDAYRTLIDRLLDSPHYGERWGRHWLDLARYVHTKIKVAAIDDIDMARPYRDYVVRAFNQDKPYDQFITEQLAGDLLLKGQGPGAKGQAADSDPSAPGPRPSALDLIIAPAFLSIGDWFEECTDPNKLRLDMIDEMMTTTGQAVLALNFNCARCHDHKFDPIPTEDYYRVAGVFRGTRIVDQFSEYWRDGRQRQTRPLALPHEVAANDALRDRIAQRRDAIHALLAERREALIKQWSEREADYRRLADELRPAVTVKAFEAEDFDGQSNLKITAAEHQGESIEYVEAQKPTELWIKYRLSVPKPGEYAFDVRYAADTPSPVELQINGATVVKEALAANTGGWSPTHQHWETAGVFTFRPGVNFIRIDGKAKTFPAIDRIRLVRRDDAFAKIDQAASDAGLDARLLARFVLDSDQPYPTAVGIEPFVSESVATTLAAHREAIAELTAQITAYQPVLAVTDYEQPRDLPVHIRGEVYQTTDQTVPRGAPTLFDHLVPRPAVPDDRSGRLVLAQWLTHPDNPLTPRVMANRIWHWHFGRGIVATVSDFGLMGADPTHPQLLDWLADEFINSGWSVKHLHRQIMLSSTYRQASTFNERNATADPDNKLLWRFEPRRLEVEALYDAMLTSTGKVERQPAGSELDVFKSEDRALYVLTSGRSPVGLGLEIRKMFPLFDFDDSGVAIQKRERSVTAAQALWWLNNPLPKHFATEFAKRLLAMEGDDEHRVKQMHLIALGRFASPQQVQRTLDYMQHCVENEGLTREEAWARVCLAIYSSNEFRYLD